jgi:hypothetical protein
VFDNVEERLLDEISIDKITYNNILPNKSFEQGIVTLGEGSVWLTSFY